MIYGGIKVSSAACQGCVNCIRSCPTEAIRVVNGEITIMPGLCVDCGECLRSCRHKALSIREDDWNRIKEFSRVAVITDPVFFSQFNYYPQPELLEEVLNSMDITVLTDELQEAFDLAAYAAAQALQHAKKENLPLISVYCPAVVRLIQVKFPELLARLVPVETPLEIAADLWRTRTNNTAPITLLAPCPAKIAMLGDPQGRKESTIDNGVTVRRVARSIMAAGDMTIDRNGGKCGRNNRWMAWARRAGESKHVQMFSEKKLTVLAVSGMRNTLDTLQELELGRLRGVDFVECRFCDTGCVGGMGNADSRFLASLRVGNIDTEWQISQAELERTEMLYAMDIWPVTKEIEPRPRTPLSNNVAEAMQKLKEMNEIYSALPHIDCGSCGRPSCQVMAEEIVRGHGSVTDCIFKLREGIADLANKIAKLSESQPHTLKKKDTGNEDR